MKKMNRAYSLDVLWAQEFYEMGMEKEKIDTDLPQNMSSF